MTNPGESSPTWLQGFPRSKGAMQCAFHWPERCAARACFVPMQAHVVVCPRLSCVSALHTALSLHVCTLPLSFRTCSLYNAWCGTWEIAVDAGGLLEPMLHRFERTMLNVFARNHSESPKHAPVRPLHAPISPLARAESHPCAR